MEKKVWNHQPDYNSFAGCMNWYIMILIVLDIGSYFYSTWLHAWYIMINHDDMCLPTYFLKPGLSNRLKKSSVGKHIRQLFPAGWFGSSNDHQSPSIPHCSTHIVLQNYLMTYQLNLFMHQIFQQNNYDYDICQFCRHLSMTRRYACQSSVCLFQGGRKPRWWHHFNGKPWDTRNGYHRWAGRTGGVLLHGLEQGMMGMISEPHFCWLYPR